MALVDPRRRPISAGLAFSLGLFVMNGVMFLRLPAFAHVHPDPIDALVAVVLTVVAALVATSTATAFEARVAGRETGSRVASTVVTPSA
jgi:hypothetical protein